MKSSFFSWNEKVNYSNLDSKKAEMSNYLILLNLSNIKRCLYFKGIVIGIKPKNSMSMKCLNLLNLAEVSAVDYSCKCSPAILVKY